MNGKCGYPLGDALEKKYTGLNGRDDKMFVGIEFSISLRIEVCLDWHDSMMVLNYVCSGSRIRAGQSRSVTTPVIHRVGINESYGFKC